MKSDARPIRLWFTLEGEEVPTSDVDGMKRLLMKVREKQGRLEALARELTEYIAIAEGR